MAERSLRNEDATSAAPANDQGSPKMMDSGSEVECRVVPSVVRSKDDVIFANDGRGSSRNSVDLNGGGCEETNLMEIVTCLACDGDGSLLVCDEKGCGFAVHKKCLPCSAYFDASGSFYCPQCSYERAMEECSQAKKRASLAKQALLKFISAADGNNHQPEVEATDGKQPSPSTSERDVFHLAQEGELQEKRDSVMCKRSDSPESLREEHCGNEHTRVFFPAEVDPGDNSQKTMDHLVHPGTSLESEKKKNLVNKKTLTELYSAPNQGKQTQEFATPTKHTSISQDWGTDNLHTSEVEGGEAQLHVLQKTDSPARVGLTEKHHDTERRVENDLSNISNATKRKRQDDEISEESNGRDELFIEESDISDSDIGTTINKKPNVKIREKEKRAKYAQRSSNDSDIQNVNADESVKGRQARESATSSQKKRLSNSDNQGKSETSPYTRRRIHWTAEEVEILKEGVRKFSVPHQKMPWGRILEYGSQVFDHCRTAGDLKDKWRNLTK